MIKLDYELLDSGVGYRLERFGKIIIARPDATAIWMPKNPIVGWKYDVKAIIKNGGSISWDIKKPAMNDWRIQYGELSLSLKLSGSKNIGIFPEQQSNWQWLDKVTRGFKGEAQVLNLFGYTGVATLVLAAAGARVCHVDSSTAAMNWFLKNKELSNMGGLRIRHIVDDCIKFVKREIARGTKYDGIILDPPAFGRGTEGEIFKFEEHVPLLLELCKKLLRPKPLFVLLNSYSMGYSPRIVANLLVDYFPSENLNYGELVVEGGGRVLPCAVFARVG